MSVEIILLGLACGMTLLAYMVAINAHGPSRLSLSYLIATVMLAGTVWAIVKYVNTDLDAKKMQALQQRFEAEKKMADERIHVQEQVYREIIEKTNFASKLSTIISKGSILSSSINNVNLLDKSLEMDGLLGRAAETKRKVDELRKEISSSTANSIYYSDAVKLIEEAAQLLSDASYYYRLFYHSEDAEQELIREKAMRQKARLASDKFQSASGIIGSGK